MLRDLYTHPIHPQRLLYWGTCGAGLLSLALLTVIIYWSLFSFSIPTTEENILETKNHTHNFPNKHRETNPLRWDHIVFQPLTEPAPPHIKKAIVQKENIVAPIIPYIPPVPNLTIKYLNYLALSKKRPSALLSIDNENDWYHIGDTLIQTHTLPQRSGSAKLSEWPHKKSYDITWTVSTLTPTSVILECSWDPKENGQIETVTVKASF